MCLVIIALVVFLTYLVGIISMFGIPASISDTYYLLEKKRKGLGWLFTAMCWLVGGLLLPALLDITPESFQFTAFLSCAGLIFVGTAPQFKLQLTGIVHYSSAGVCVMFSQLWTALSRWWVLLLVWLSYIACTAIAVKRQKEGVFWYRFRKTKPMFWIEIASFAATFLAIFLK
ncbi:glycosyl transferase [Parabacteroides goldsteinii]|uniref:glycosyl transferase n=1 Tax=Parabacteroides goldsteinii TaxID=328812 RepID=UPI0032B1B4B7